MGRSWCPVVVVNKVVPHPPPPPPLFILLVVVVMMMLLLLPGSSNACPADCGCKWKGGKQWVECVSKNFRTFPPTIDPGTQVLDMSGNSFETLPPDHFMRSGLINLQKIFLSKCRLNHINSRAFRGLSNLVELDIGYNLLRDVPSSAFPDMGGLMRLVLSGNPIAIVAKRAFVVLESLTTLELSGTGLELIEHAAFEGLNSLEWLKIDSNRLKTVKGLSILPLSLKGDNPWECDCHLLELRLWLRDRNVASSAEPRCSGPDRLANMTIKSLPSDTFACFPQLSPTTMFQKIGEGKNVSLLCKVLSVPESSLEWLFNGSPLTNSSLNLLIETTSAYPSSSSPLSSSSPSLSTPIEKKSELLILNATSDENGTFLCLAKNPAGTTSANFTLKVLTKYDPTEAMDYSTLSGTFGQLPSLVSNYPNLFIIGLSTVAVIGLVLILSTLSFILCKCGSFLMRKSSRNNNSARGRRDSFKNQKHSENSGSGSVPCKLDRSGLLSLSDASTLTTSATKSNGGSVFLLSSADSNSNPDLIEGAVLGGKRGDGDGLDSAIYNQQYHQHPGEGGPIYYSSPSITNSPSIQQQQILLVPNSTNTTFSPTSPLGNNNGGSGVHHDGHSHHQPPPHSSQPSWPMMDFNNGGLPPLYSVSIPSNYDLSKYPKEYINPIQQQQQQQFQPQFQPNYEYTVYTAATDHHYPPHSFQYHPHHLYNSHHHHPHGSASVPPEYSNSTLPPPSSNPNCSCGPILEGNETEESSLSPPSMDTAPMTTTGCPSVAMTTGCQTLSTDILLCPPPPTTKTASTSTPLRSSSSERLNSSSLVNKKNKGTSGVNTSSSSPLQMQNHPQINESPDEGYEDGGAEGTEI